DPFDNSAGFQFPPPEGLGLSYLPHLLVAQAFIPPTERTEVAGFDFPGDNYAIRAEVLRRLNATPAYRMLFGQVFPEVSQGAPITPLIGNLTFDGPGEDEDFGLEQVTGNAEDRYKFRTSPLRNVALQPAFFHNGAFTRLEDAVRHHLDVFTSARNYDPIRADIA